MDDAIRTGMLIGEKNADPVLDTTVGLNAEGGWRHLHLRQICSHNNLSFIYPCKYVKAYQINITLEHRQMKS